MDIIKSAIGHLMYTTQRDRFKVAEIADHLHDHWESIADGRAKDSGWRIALNSYLTNRKDVFERPERFYWALSTARPSHILTDATARTSARTRRQPPLVKACPQNSNVA